jgi:hypothetical protein
VASLDVTAYDHSTSCSVVAVGEATCRERESKGGREGERENEKGGQATAPGFVSV